MARYRIRKADFANELYLMSNGKWTKDWSQARRFRSQDAADKFAKKFNLGNRYGLFQYKP